MLAWCRLWLVRRLRNWWCRRPFHSWDSLRDRRCRTAFGTEANAIFQFSAALRTVCHRYTSLLEMIAVGSHANRPCGYVVTSYFKILNLPIIGSSFAFPFSALMIPMTARTVITMLRMGAMIHPRIGIMRMTEERIAAKNRTSP